jgi:hypothetical protein
MHCNAIRGFRGSQLRPNSNQTIVEADKLGF